MSTSGPGPTAPGAITSSASDGAAAAFAAGWLVAQLHGPILTRPVKSPSHLPTMNELGRADRVNLTFNELHHLISGPLATQLTPEGDEDAITIESVRAAWDPGHPSHYEPLKSAIEKLHIQLLERLTVADRILGSAYSTGRSLSDTCWLPRSKADFDYMFNKYRLANIQGWLSDIAPALPKLSAPAVSQSLDHWVSWLAVHKKLRWDKDGVAVETAARAQGEHWRAALLRRVERLVGVLQQLLRRHPVVRRDGDPDAGAHEAGEAALRRAGEIIRRIAIDFWVPLLIVALATALAVAAAIRYSEGTAKFWAAAVSLASGLGVTGKSIQATAKRLASDASKPLLDLADADAMSWAVTWLPSIDNDWRNKRRLRQLGVAPPQGVVLDEPENPKE